MIIMLAQCDICHIKQFGVQDGGMFHCKRCNPGMFSMAEEENKQRVEAREAAAYERLLCEQEDALPPEAPPRSDCQV